MQDKLSASPGIGGLMPHFNGRERVPAEDREVEILMESLAMAAGITKRRRAPREHVTEEPISACPQGPLRRHEPQSHGSSGLPS